MAEYTKEELKTLCGIMMVDLRGNWGWGYTERMESVVDWLEQLIEIAYNDEERSDYTEDLETTQEELEAPYDGRVFRDFCNLYGYRSSEGLTERVKEVLEADCTHPEYLELD